MVYSGIIVIKKEFEGSKSEGNCAYLNTGETEYRLFRMGAFSVNDDFFYPFEGKKVEIEGTVTDNWLSVEKISGLPENNVDAEENCDEHMEQQERKTETDGETELNTEQEERDEKEM